MLESMKRAMLLTTLLLLVGGCTIVRDFGPTPDTPSAVSGTSDLILTDQDLKELSIVNDGIDCTTETYETSASSPLAQYSVCMFNLTETDTEVVLEVKRFTNAHDLNGSYQYDSSHYFGAKGLLGEDTLGDQSKLRVNNEDDYGAEFNPPGVYYYHLWFTKDLYLVHITSKGPSEVENEIGQMGRRILSKFG